MSEKIPVVKMYLNKLKPEYGSEFTQDLELFMTNSNLDETGKVQLLDLVKEAYEIGKHTNRENIKISG